MVLTLYKKDTSAPCTSVFMVMEALNLKDVEYVNINLMTRDHFKEDYLKMNPQHTVPTLKDGDFVIWDSHAIATYLVSKYAKDDSLCPKDLQKRAIVDQRLHFDSSVLFPALKQTMVPLLYKGETSIRPENLEAIKAAYDLMENFFFGPWLTGGNLTLADICCFGTIGSLNIILPVDAKVYPKLAAWVERCSTMDIHVNSCSAARQTYREFMKKFLP